MNIALFGTSLLSAYHNHAATYFRGILRALHARGHTITFYEPDILARQQYRDIQPPSWAEVVLYEHEQRAALEQVEAAQEADLILKTSGVTPFDTLLEEALLECKRPGTLVAYWDVDIPTTLNRIHADPCNPAYRLIPRYDFVLTRGGGAEILGAYEALGARECVSIPNALDPGTHFPSPSPDEQFVCDLAFLGNYHPERQAKVEEYFLEAAVASPDASFLLAGHGWGDIALPPNVRNIGYVGTRLHNAIHSSALAVLSLHSPAITRCGFTPAARLFEAGGAGSCIISDDWPGLEDFFEPDYEILLARNGEEVAEQLNDLRAQGRGRACSLGNGALRRCLREHTYTHRAISIDTLLARHIAKPHPEPRPARKQRRESFPTYQFTLPELSSFPSETVVPARSVKPASPSPLPGRKRQTAATHEPSIK